MNKWINYSYKPLPNYIWWKVQTLKKNVLVKMPMGVCFHDAQFGVIKKLSRLTSMVEYLMF
jgi:hypothetical protein